MNGPIFSGRFGAAVRSLLSYPSFDLALCVQRSSEQLQENCLAPGLMGGSRGGGGGQVVWTPLENHKLYGFL